MFNNPTNMKYEFQKAKFISFDIYHRQVSIDSQQQRALDKWIGQKNLKIWRQLSWRSARNIEAPSQCSVDRHLLPSMLASLGNLGVILWSLRSFTSHLMKLHRSFNWWLGSGSWKITNTGLRTNLGKNTRAKLGIERKKWQPYNSGLDILRLLYWRKFFIKVGVAS